MATENCIQLQRYTGEMDLAEYKQFFQGLGVTCLKPGFFDHEAFLTAERQNSRLLEDYARYCQLVTADPEYRECARVAITETISYVAPYVQADDCQGLCVKIALLLSRFLERQGVWNYIENGGLVIQYPGDSKLRPKELDPHFFRGGTHGHGWLVAPPFRIIDLAITRQFYEGGEENYRPDMVISDDAEPTQPWPFPQGPPNREIARSFPPSLLRQGQLVLTYVPYGIGGPSESFEEMAHPSFNGLSPFDLFKKYLGREDSAQ